MRNAGPLLVLIGLLCAGVWTYGTRSWTLLQSTERVEITPERPFEAAGDTIVRLRPATFAPDAVDLDVLLDNAVFEPERSRPQPEQAPAVEAEPVAVVEAAPTAAPPSLDITILGIVLQGEAGYLVIKSDRGQRPEQLSLGDEVDGWELVELTGLTAVFARDGKETRVDLALR